MEYKNWERVGISHLLGKMVESITLNDDKTELTIVCKGGYRYLMMHEQDCCESVWLDDLDGELSDWQNVTVLEASESASLADSTEMQWTFYRLACNLHSLCLRWCGSTDSVYSMGVTLFVGFAK